MANVRVVTAIRNARLDELNNKINFGSGPGTINFYSGTQPANADAAIGAQLLLGTCTFPDPAAPSPAVNGVLTFGTIIQDSAADPAAGAGTVCTWARIRDSVPNTVFDCDVTASGGGGTIQLNTVTIVAGGPIQISSFQLTDPAT